MFFSVADMGDKNSLWAEKVPRGKITSATYQLTSLTKLLDTPEKVLGVHS